MSARPGLRERATSVLLTLGFIVVGLTAVDSVASLDRNEAIAEDMEAARSAAERGDLETAFERLMDVIEQVPDSVGALRSAACIAPAAGQGELVPLLLADLLLANWDWRKVSIGCEIEQFYRSLFRVFEVGPFAIIYRLPDVEDAYSRELLDLGLERVAEAPEDVEPQVIAELMALAACINTRHGLVAMGNAQIQNALNIDPSAAAVLPRADECVETTR